MKKLKNFLIPQLLFILNSHFAFSNDEMLCQNRQIELLQSFDSYMKDAEKSLQLPEKYKESLNHLQNIVNAKTEDSSCDQIIQIQYAKLSLKSILKIKSSPSQNLNQKVNDLILFFEKLSDNNKLQPLTPEKRFEFGGIWNEMSKKNKTRFNILGAYDCNFSTIWFDPTLSALDLGAVLIHEFDHLFRDKISFQSDWANIIQPEMLIIADEVIANMMGAYSQLRFDFDSNRAFSYLSPKERFYLFKSNNPKKFLIPEKLDLNLYNKKGPLSKIWFTKFQEKTASMQNFYNEIKKDDLEITPLNSQPFSYKQFDNKSSVGIPVFGGYDEIYDDLSFENTKIYLKEIVKIVTYSYFKERDLNEEEIEQITSIIINKLKKPSREESNLSPLKESLSTSNVIQNINYENLLNSINTPSESCKILSNIKISKEGGRPAVDSSKLSKEGGRPAIDSSKLSKEGGRPAIDSSKLSKEGGRPSLEVRPCLIMKEEL